MHSFLKFIFGIKLYMFQTVPLSIIRSSSLYKQQWCTSYAILLACRIRTELSSVLIPLASCQQNLYDIYHCFVYSEKLLMMDRETVRNV
jgi:hypothetical protein